MSYPQPYNLGLIRTDRGEFKDAGNQVFDVTNPQFGRGGARGDGIKDDTEALQAAADAAAAAGGGVMFLPMGTYKITAKITLKLGVSVVGCGRSSTVVVQYADADCFYALDTNAANIVMVDLTISDGLGIASRTAGHGINFTAVGIGARFCLDRVHVSGFYHSFNFGDAGYAEIRNCRAISSKYDGFHFATGQHTMVTMTSCGSTGAGQYGCFADGASHFTFNSCFMDSSALKGWYMLNGRECTFNSTSGEENVVDAYYFDTCQQLTFNSISGSRQSCTNGVVLDDCSRITFNSPLFTRLTGYGIKLVGSNHDIVAINPKFDTIGTADVLDTDGVICTYKNDAWSHMLIGGTGGSVMTYSALPSASQYYRRNAFYIINDANTTTPGAMVSSGGGSNTILVVSSGSNWRCIAGY